MLIITNIAVWPFTLWREHLGSHPYKMPSMWNYERKKIEGSFRATITTNIKDTNGWLAMLLTGAVPRRRNKIQQRKLKKKNTVGDPKYVQKKYAEN